VALTCAACTTSTEAPTPQQTSTTLPSLFDVFRVQCTRGTDSNHPINNTVDLAMSADVVVIGHVEGFSPGPQISLPGTEYVRDTVIMSFAVEDLIKGTLSDHVALWVHETFAAVDDFRRVVPIGMKMLLFLWNPSGIRPTENRTAVAGFDPDTAYQLPSCGPGVFAETPGGTTDLVTHAAYPGVDLYQMLEGQPV
jgi:hypothetical protein